tara:strand:+ start:488 stop:1114 length:627 start_codon:yes stop_codon:yes gene_type:complete
MMYNIFALYEPKMSPKGCPDLTVIDCDGTQGVIINAEPLGYTNKFIKLFKPETEESAKWENRAKIYQKLRDYMIGAEENTGAKKEMRFLIPEIIDVNDHLPCLCQTFGRVQHIATIFDILVKLDDPQKMSKEAYRFLNKSIDILATIGVVHGDLPGNVMQHPTTKMPIIIDFDNGRTAITTEIYKESFDRRAFLNNFKAVKRKLKNIT